MLAWVDTVLRGGALSLDIFCLYGPLSIWPVAVLFRSFGPSIALWRGWIFAAGCGRARRDLSAAARPAAHAHGRARGGGGRSALFCSATIPGMTWSPSRVGLGLGALACLCRSDGPQPRRWLAGTGALLGAALLYSQEVGVAGSVGVAAALALRARSRERVRVDRPRRRRAARARGRLHRRSRARSPPRSTTCSCFRASGCSASAPCRSRRSGGRPCSLRAYLVPALLGVSGNGDGDPTARRRAECSRRDRARAVRLRGAAVRGRAVAARRGALLVRCAAGVRAARGSRRGRGVPPRRARRPARPARGGGVGHGARGRGVPAVLGLDRGQPGRAHPSPEQLLPATRAGARRARLAAAAVRVRARERRDRSPRAHRARRADLGVPERPAHLLPRRPAAGDPATR